MSNENLAVIACEWREPTFHRPKWDATQPRQLLGPDSQPARLRGCQIGPRWKP